MSNRFSKYTLYALGEIILVVIGILIALQVNNWNEDRLQQKLESGLLEELELTLERDIQILEQELLRMDSALNRISRLHEMLGEHAPEPSEALFEMMGSVYGVKKVDLNRAVYRDIQAEGLRVIRDKELRSLIIHVFEDHYSKIEATHEMEHSINQVNRPYYLQHFRDIRFSKYARPVDLEQVWADNYYRNIVYYRQATLEANQLTSYPRALADMKRLLKRCKSA